MNEDNPLDKTIGRDHAWVSSLTFDGQDKKKISFLDWYEKIEYFVFFFEI